jgi:hypothetical protein
MPRSIDSKGPKIEFLRSDKLAERRSYLRAGLRIARGKKRERLRGSTAESEPVGEQEKGLRRGGDGSGVEV